jgi:hypothetical protein
MRCIVFHVNKRFNMMLSKKLLTTIFVLACASTRANTVGPHAIDAAMLSDAAVTMHDVSQPNTAGKAFIAGTVINAPTRKLCSIILDFPNYPSFMPNTAQAKVSQATGEFSLVDMTLQLPLGKIKKYRLKMEPKTGEQLCRLSWKLVPWEGLKPEETIVDTTGYWELIPLASNRNKTVVKYFVYTDPGAIPTGFGWIVDSLSKDSIPKTLEALRKKAQQN